MMRPRTNRTISAGTSVTDSSAAAAMAKVLVKASGLNSRPSCASSAKIGRNETVMTSRLKNSAGPTSTAASISTSARGLSGRRALQMLVRVLDHDDRRVDHRADGDRDAAEAHDVGAQAQQIHAEIGDQHAERQRDDGDQRAADMQQEHDADERDDEALLDERALERVDRAVDEVGAVVDRPRCHALGQARRDLGERSLTLRIT